MADGTDDRPPPFPLPDRGLNRCRLRFARARSHIPGMSDRALLQKALANAEAELDAATTLTAVKAAAKRLQRAKADLRELEAAERPKRKAKG
jgi:hypothetical protein